MQESDKETIRKAIEDHKKIAAEINDLDQKLAELSNKKQELINKLENRRSNDQKLMNALIQKYNKSDILSEIKKHSNEQ